MSTQKLNTIGNSSELYFRSCTEVSTASRSYTQIFLFHFTSRCTKLEQKPMQPLYVDDEASTAARYTHLHCAPNSTVLYIRSYCVCTAVMFYTVYVHIYNTVALVKNNSTVLFSHPFLGSLLKQQNNLLPSRGAKRTNLLVVLEMKLSAC